MKAFLFKNWIMVFLAVFCVVRLSDICATSWFELPNELSACLLSKSFERSPIELSNSDNFRNVRHILSLKVKDQLPPENSSLVLGLVLGINELYYLPEFRELLVNTGTIHVVVASGFNISLVASLLTTYSKTKYGPEALFFVVLGTFIYAVVTGFEPPIFRAWLMSVTTIVFANVGRVLPGLKVLVFTALVMLAINPLYLFDLSFQLSFLATFGIIYYSDFFEFLFETSKGTFIRQDFVTTVSAQIFVLPLLLKVIGTVSLLGFIVNPLTLWIIPISTILGFIFILCVAVSETLGALLAPPMYLLTQFFVSSLRFFDRIPHLALTAPSNGLYFVAWYLFALVLPKLILEHYRTSMK